MNELSQFLVESILGEADSVDNIVVVYAGRFQPFHKGHYATYSHLVKKFGKNNVFIGTSNKTDNQKSPFNFKEKKEIMTTMFGVPSSKIVEVKNPYAPSEILNKFDDSTTAFITVVGEKDSSRLSGKYFTPLKGEPTEGYKDRGYVYTAPAQSNPISGTDVRMGMRRGSDDDKKQFFTKKAYGKFNPKIFKLISDKLSSLPEITSENIWIPKYIVEEWLIDNVDLIKEASTIAGKTEVDDGPNFLFPSYAAFDKISQRRAEKIGYTVLAQIMSDELTDIDSHPIYPKGPVKAVTPFPAGVVGKITATNQKDYYGSVAYNKWYKHVTRVAGLAGYSLINSIDTIITKQQSLRTKKIPTLPLTVIKEAITIPVEIGDTILMGKFKNKKVVVKTIGKDEYGMPTINGKKVATFRMIKEGKTINYNFISEAEIVRLNNTLGIERDELPQIDKDSIETYLEYLESKNIPFEIYFQPVASLNSSQSKIDLDKINDIMSDDNSNNTPIIVSKDDYILDGHHRALAAYNLDRESEIPTIKVHLPIGELIDVSNEFNGSHNEDLDEQTLNEFGGVRFDAIGYDKDGKQVDMYLPRARFGFEKNIVHAAADKLFKSGISKGNGIKYIEIYYDKHHLGTIRLPRNFTKGKDWDKLPITEMPMADLVKIDQYADKQLNPVDVVLTDKHFFDRLNDPRNGKEISNAELIGFFKRLAKKKKPFMDFLTQYGQIVAKDNRTNINIPFMKQANKVIAKTIMRKDGFKTSSPEYQFEKKKLTYNEPYALGGGISEGLIMEGGAYGHMNHPFDTEINLTFGQLKDIVNKALEGNLELTREKTDGQALAISWVNGRLVAARNKGHLKNKGAGALDINGVAMKFAGRGELEKAYNFAMKDLSNAISKLSEKQREKIFKGGACFMNLEVIYPTSVNVIPYGQALLVFHGTMEYNEDGIAIGENQDAAKILAGMIKQVNQQVQSAYTIQGPPVTQLPKSQNLSSLKGKYNGQISKLQSQFKLKDSDGIADYHQAWWMDFVTKKSPSALDNKTLMGLVQRWAFYDKSFRLDSKNITDEKVLAWAQGIDKNDHAKIAKDNIRPFEDIFLGVGSDVLSFMSSVLTANPDSAVRSMKKRLDQTIADVKKGGDPKKVAKLKLELERLNAIGGKNKIVPNEGIVFVYGGKTFKLTGTFAPLNQILGLFYE